MRSKVLGTSGSTASLMREMLESLSPVGAGLQSVFEEETCLIHNVYGGFGESKVRVFANYSPTIRTPKGGGHLPFKLKTNGDWSSLTVEECEMIMGIPTGWTDLER